MIFGIKEKAIILTIAIAFNCILLDYCEQKLQLHD